MQLFWHGQVSNGLVLGDKISIIFDPTKFIPSPAQGALAVEVRADDAETKEIVSKLDDKDARIITTAERLVFSALGCGCHAPAGVFANLSRRSDLSGIAPQGATTEAKTEITISTCLSDPDGSNYREFSLSGPIAEFTKLVRQLAEKLR